MNKEVLERIDKYLDSPEGKAETEAYFKMLDQEKAMHDLHIDRCYKALLTQDMDSLIEKVVAKYRSDKYRDMWYGRGIEPPENLYYLLYDVAEKYGREYTNDEYADMKSTMFTQHVYVLGNWTFELIVGQGSAILIDKIK